MYKGKECCAGCGKSGVEIPRYEKEKLCRNCQEIFNLGKSVKHEELMEYTYVFQHNHAFCDERLGKLAKNILEVLNNPTAEAKTHEQTGFKYSQGSNGVSVKIKSNLFKPLKEFFIEADELFANHKKSVEDLPKIVKEAIREGKNSIYNEGVEEGRNLLMGLNRGDITMDDFNKTVMKY